MKKFLLLTVLTLVTLANVPFAHAQITQKFPDTNPVISISFPEGWTLKEKGENYAEIESPEAAIDFDLWTMKAEDIDTSMNDVIDNMKAWLTDIKLAKNPSADFEMNGIKFTAMTGTGMPSKAEDKSHGEQQIEAYFGSADGGKTLTVIVYFGDKGAGDKYSADLKFIVASIKPLSGE
jgi:hypothetical protein